MNKDIKMGREGALQMPREAHSRQREQPRQRLSGRSMWAVFKENPKGQWAGAERGRGRVGGEDEAKEAEGTDHIRPCRNAGFYSQRNESHFF